MKKVNIKSKNKFGKWLKRYCNKHKIDVTSLSRRLGIDRRYVTHWIQGTSHPRTVNTIFLIEALSQITGEEPEKIYLALREHIMGDY